MSEYIIRTTNMPEHVREALSTWYEVNEEVVRCRDCTYYDGEPDLESSMPKCWRDPDHRGTAMWTQPDGFCWLGERKEDK